MELSNSQGSFSATLGIPSATPDMAGRYYVSGDNVNNVEVALHHVSVVTQPVDTPLDADGAATISCVFSGNLFLGDINSLKMYRNGFNTMPTKYLVDGGKNTMVMLELTSSDVNKPVYCEYRYVRSNTAYVRGAVTVTLTVPSEAAAGNEVDITCEASAGSDSYDYHGERGAGICSQGV